MARKTKKSHANRVVIEPLEPRILHSADLPFALPDAYVQETDPGIDSLFSYLNPSVDQPLTGYSERADLSDATGPNENLLAEAAPHERTELVFIDLSTPEAAGFVREIQSSATENVQFQYITMGGHQNGIDLISATLAQHDRVSAIHIISHGEDGQVNMGANILNTTALQQYNNAIEGWRNTLSNNADILIYGCDVASTATGREFVTAFALATGADVAASDDLSGHQLLGGDWDLEHTHGNVETRIVLSDELQSNWQATLGPTNLTSGIELNTDGGNNSILIANDGSALLGGLNSLTFEISFSTNDATSTKSLVSYATATNGNEFAFKLAGSEAHLTIADTDIVLTSIDYTNLQDTAIQHIAITWDNTDGDWALLSNGELIESGTGVEAGNTLDAGGDLVIGNEPASPGGSLQPDLAFHGSLYDIRIWNDVRTETEIAQTYQQKLDVTPADAANIGLLGNWQMDGFNSSGEIVDIVAANNLSTDNIAPPLVRHLSGWTNASAGVVASDSSITFVDDGAATGFASQINSPTLGSLGFTDNYSVSFDVPALSATGAGSQAYAIGLSHTESSPAENDIQYAVSFDSNHNTGDQVRLHALGTITNHDVSYADGDTFSFRVDGTDLHFLHNGTVFHTVSSLNGTEDWYVDTSFFASASGDYSDQADYTISDFRVSDGNLEGGGFTESVPIQGLHVVENAANGTSAGFVVPSESDINNNIVSDGRFTETPIASGFEIMTSPDSFGDWEVVNNSIVIYNDPDTVGPTPSGGRPVELASLSGPGTIQQSLDTVSGKTYQVTFALTGNFLVGDATKDLRVTAGSSSFDFSTTQPPGWTRQDPVWDLRTLSFTAAGPTTVLVFQSLDLFPAGHSVIGDISVVEIPAAVSSLLTNDSSLTYDAATGKFYRVIVGNHTFNEAHTTATTSKLNGVTGQLLTIESAYENELIKNLASTSTEYIWLGARDSAVEGEFRWIEESIDGDLIWSGGVTGAPTPGTFTQFQSGEPNNEAPSENHLTLRVSGTTHPGIQTGQWIDYDEADPLNLGVSYIVEWDAGEVRSNYQFSLTDDATGRFAIDSNSGEITVADGQRIDYEDAVSYDVGVQVTDAEGNSYSKTMAIAVIDDIVTPVNLGSGIELNSDGGNDAFLQAQNGDAVFAGAQAFTTEFIVATDHSKSVAPHLFNYSTSAQPHEVRAYFTVNNQLLFGIGGMVVPLGDVSDALDGTPRHFALSWNNSNGKVALYIDGEPRNTSTIGTGYTIGTGGTLNIGQGNPASGQIIQQALHGTLYDVRVWSDVRSAAEVAMNWQHKLASTPDDLVANWQMASINNDHIDNTVGTNKLVIAHASGNGFVTSAPAEDLHLNELASPGTSAGFIIPGVADALQDVALDGSFTHAGASGSVNITNGQIIGGVGGSWTVTSGNVDLEGSWADSPLGGTALGLDGSTPGAVNQTLNTEPGRQYQIVFATTGNFQGGNTVGDLSVSAADAAEDFHVDMPGGWTTANLLWEHRSFHFTAIDTTTDLQFASLSSSGTTGPVISDVQVFEIPQTISTILQDQPKLSYDAVTGKFYRHVGDAALWGAAQSTANNSLINGVSGQLVTIRSAYENELVRKMAMENFSPSMWLGGSDIETEGEFRWYDGIEPGELFWRGSPQNGHYTNFSTGEPNDWTGSNGQDYAAINSTTGLWDDRGGPHTAPVGNEAYIIEWNASEILSNYSYEVTDQNGIDGPLFTVGSGTGEIHLADPALPDEFTNHVAWFDASASLDVTTGTNGVTTLGDRTGTGNAAIEVGNGPTLAPATINNLDALQFDGIDEGLFVSDSATINLTNADARTISLVFESGPDTSTRQILYEQGDSSDGLNLYIDGNSLYAGVWSETSGFDGEWLEAEINENEPYVTSLTFDTNTGEIALFVNGARADSAPLPGVLRGNTATIGIGYVSGATKFHDGYFTGIDKHHFSGLMGELTYYNTAPGSENLINQHAHLMNKWMGTPVNLNYEEAISHAVEITVAGASGNTYSQAVTISVNNQLDVHQQVPGPQLISEDTTLTFGTANSNAVTVSDTVGGTDTLMQTTLQVNDGVLTLSDLTGITIIEGADGTGTLTISGTESALNASLEGMVFTPNTGFNGNVVLAMRTELNADLEGHYTFEGGTANDQSKGVLQNGSLTGSATTSNDNLRGEVLSLGGADDAVHIPGLFSNPANVTLSSWVNLNTPDTQGSHVISLGDTVSIALDLTSDTQGVSGAAYNGTTWNIVSSGQFIANTGWHHVAFSYDDDNDVQTLYIDGVEVASDTITDSLVYSLGTDTFLGSHGDGSSEFDLGGMIDDTRLYTRALTADEVAALASDQTEILNNIAITVNPVNNTPVFSNYGPGILFTENGAAEVIDSDVTVFDRELSAIDNFDNSTLYIGRAGGSSPDDTFTATGLLAPLTHGNNLVYNSTIIGTVTRNTDGELLLQFNSQATNSLVNNAMQSIAYANSSDIPSASVDLNWTFNDNNAGGQGTGGPLYATGNLSVDIVSVNDAPIFGPLPGNEGQIVDSSISGASSTSVADIDGDGNPDLVTTSLTTGEIVFYRGDGAGGTGTGTVVTSSLDEPQEVSIADLDGDGDLDLIVADYSNAQDNLIIYTNDGTGNFLESVLDSSTGGVIQVDTGDLDGDGDIDIAANFWFSGEVVWYENLGSGSFGKTVVDTSAGGTGIEIADINLDGQDDIIASFRNSHTVVYYENNGAASSFTPSSFNVSQAFDITTGDLDSDGDIDLGYIGLSGALGWLANDGGTSPGFTDNPLTDIGRGVQISAADIDNDGDTDLLATLDSAGEFRQYENDGAGNFIQSTFATAVSAQEIIAADLDNDGDLDIVTSSSSSADVQVFNNIGAGEFRNYITSEDTPLTLDPVSFTDSDAGTSSLAVTIDVVGGTINLPVIAGLGFTSGDGNRDSTLVFNGTTTALNAALNAIQFEPATNFNGPASIDILIDDQGNTGTGGPGSISTSVKIDVLPINDSPVFQNNTGAVVSAGDTLTLTRAMLLEGDPDDAGADLTYSVVTAPTQGYLALSAAASTPISTFTQDDIDNDRVIYVHNGLSVSNDSFALELADNGSDGSTPASGTFTITLAGALPDRYTTDEETPLTVPAATGLLANDAAGSTPFIAASDNTSAIGAVAVNADGSFTYDPDGQFDGLTNGQSATDTFTYTYDDGNGNSEIETVTITVNGVNELPTTNNALSAIGFEDNTRIQITVRGEDVDGTVDSIRITSLPANGTLYADFDLNTVVVVNTDYPTTPPLHTRPFYFVPNHNWNGTTTFNYIARDNNGELDATAATGTLEVAEVNDVPVRAAGVVDDLVINENSGITSLGLEALQYSAGGGMDEAGQTLTYEIFLIPDPAVGTIFLADGTTTVTTGTPYTLSQLQGMQISPAAEPAPAANTFAFRITDDGSNDGAPLPQSLSEFLSVTVNPVNDIPVLTTNNFTIAEGASLLVTTTQLAAADPDNTDLAFLASNISNGHFAMIGDPLVAIDVFSQAQVTANQILFIHDGGEQAPSFDITVSDSVSSSTPVPGNISFSSVNDDPYNSGTLPFELIALEDIETTVDTSAVVLADTDIANGEMSLTINTAGGTLHATQTLQLTITGNNTGNLTLNGTQLAINTWLSATTSLSYTGTANAYGSSQDNISFAVSDNGNTGTAGGTTINLGSIEVNISSVNDAPVAADNSVTTLEDTDYIFTATDFRFTDPVDADALLAVTIHSLPAVGLLLLNDSPVTAGASVEAIDITAGMLKFRPDTDVNGSGYTDFLFRVQDDGGTSNSGIDIDLTARTMTINVTSVNDAPVGTSKNLSTPENTDYELTVADFGFSDIQDSDNFLSVIIDTLPGKGQLLLNNTPVPAGYNTPVSDIVAGNLVFRPDNNENGQNYASFFFRVQDDGGTANGGTNIDAAARITIIDVTSINDAPAGTGNSITTPEDTGYTFAIDDFGFTDINDGNELLAVTIDSTPENGELLLGGFFISAGDSIPASAIASGNMAFRPAAHDNGANYAVFSFRVQDDGGNNNGGSDIDSTPRNMNIDVTSVNDAPRGSDNIATTLEDTDYFFTPADFGYTDAADSDNFLAITIENAPAKGQLLLDGIAISAGDTISVVDVTAGKLAFRPATNDHGHNYTNFDFRVQDDAGTAGGGIDIDTTPRTLTIDVTSVNDAPAATPQPVTTLEDTDYTFVVSDFGFTDINDGNVLLAIILDSTPAKGQLLLAGSAISAGDSVSVIDIIAGNLVFRPQPQDHGSDYAGFNFRVQDNDGNDNGGADTDITSRTLTIDVIAVSDAPAGTDNTVTTAEDTDYVFATADFGYTDTNDGDALSGVVIDELPTGGRLTLSGVPVTAGDFIAIGEIFTGELQYRGESNANGTGYDQLGFRVVDTGTDGSANTDILVRALLFDVLEVNDAPVTTNRTIVTSEDAEYVFSRNDFEFTDTADGHTLSAVTIKSLPDTGTLWHRGVAINTGDNIDVLSLDAGELVYQPLSNFLNNTSQNGFSFTVTDSGGVVRGGDNTSNTSFITIDLLNVNDPPVLVTNGATLAEGRTVVIDSSMLGGIDADDSGLDELLMTVTSTPAHGQLMLNGHAITAGTSFTLEAIEAGSLSYSHDESETSVDGFGVSLADGGEDGSVPAQGRFELSVTEVIDAPVELNPDSLQLAHGQSFDSTQGDLLASGFSSLTNGGLTNNTAWLVELESAPTQGIVELQSDGTFTYRHNGSGVLTDEFSYRVTNEDGVFTIATVAVTIEPPIAPALEEPQELITPDLPDIQPLTREIDATPPSETSEDEVVQGSVDQTSEQLLPEDAALRFIANSTDDERRIAILSEIETRQTLQVDTLQPEFTTPKSIAVKQHREHEDVINHNEFQVVSATTFEIAFEVNIPSPGVIASNPGFLQGLAQLENDLSEHEKQNGTRYKLAEETMLGVSFSVTVGLLAWALRGGALVASMMAFTPLWTFIDMGRVTSASSRRKLQHDNQAPTEEDARVESMFEKSER